MPDKDKQTQDPEPSAKPNKEPEAADPEPTVDLDAEAAAAARKRATSGDEDFLRVPKGAKTLEDLPEPLRRLFESETSRAVNGALEAERAKARASQPSQQTKSQDTKDGLSAEQVVELVSKVLDAHSDGQAIMAKVFAEEALTPEQRNRVSAYYAKERKAGRVSADVLLDEAALRTLVYKSGALIPEEEEQPIVSPGHGYNYTGGANEGRLKPDGGIERAVNTDESSLVDQVYKQLGVK